MSLASVRAELAARAPELVVIDGHASTATVADAAATLGVAPARTASVELAPARLAQLVGESWVDVCTLREGYAIERAAI